MSPFEAAWHSGSTESNRRTIAVEIGPRLPEGGGINTSGKVGNTGTMFSDLPRVEIP